MRSAATGSEENTMNWEDIVGLVITAGLLVYLLWAMLKAEEV